MKRWHAETAEELARAFHDVYERLANDFAYETRKETRQFDPTTPNGRLMVATCAEILKHYFVAPPTPTPQGQSRSETGATVMDNGDIVFRGVCLRSCADLKQAWRYAETINSALDIERANKAQDEQSAPAAERVLESEWRHSNGMLFCGTMRIAKADFDTDPAPDFKQRVFDDICNALNAPSPSQDTPQPTASSACSICKFTLVEHRLNPSQFDHEFSYEQSAQEKLVDASVEEALQRLEHECLITAARESGLCKDITLVCSTLRALVTASPSEDTKRLRECERLLAAAATHLVAPEIRKEIGAYFAAMSSPSVTQTKTSATPPALSAQGQQSKETDWVFDRYRNGTLMAEGARVHASTFELALIKAKALFHDHPKDTFKLRLNLSPSEPAGRAGSVAPTKSESVSATPKEKQ